MKKVTDQREELESVAGGSACRTNKIACPNCGKKADVSYFMESCIRDGCDVQYFRTCPICNHRWRYE